MNGRTYLWDLFLSDTNTLQSNKIIYKYSHLHIENIFLYEKNIGVIIAPQQIIYFQYGVNRLSDYKTVLESEKIRLERHPTMIDALNVGDEEIKYLFMMPQSLYLA